MSSMLKYRGYYGSIEVSTEDNCLFGKLQFIRALVNYEGETVAELEKAFQEAGYVVHTNKKRGKWCWFLIGLVRVRLVLSKK